jgi:hypothetical protein
MELKNGHDYRIDGRPLHYDEPAESERYEHSPLQGVPR